MWFWGSQCIDTEDRSVLCYDAMTWFICINTLTLYEVSKRQITESIINNEFEVIRKEIFATYSSCYPGIRSEPPLRQPLLSSEILTLPSQTEVQNVTDKLTCPMKSGNYGLQSNVFSIQASLWTPVNRTISDTHALCFSPSNTFPYRTLNRPGKRCSVTVQTCQHYGATYCLGIRASRWHKFAIRKFQRTGKYTDTRCHCVPWVVKFSGKGRRNYQRSSRQRQ